MQEQNAFPRPPTEPNAPNLQEQLLLSPNELTNPKQHAPLPQRSTDSGAHPLFLGANRQEQVVDRLDDSLLLSGLEQGDSKVIALPWRPVEAETRLGEAIGVPGTMSLLGQMNELRQSERPLLAEETGKNHQSQNAKVSQCQCPAPRQNQTIFQSTYINLSCPDPTIRKQPKSTSPLKPCQNEIDQNQSHRPTVPTPNKQPSMLAPHLNKDNHEQLLFQGNLLQILSGFEGKFLQHSQQSCPDLPADQLPLSNHQPVQEIQCNRNEEESKDNCQSSMIVNYSDQKNLKQPAEMVHSPGIPNNIESLPARAFEAMEIQEKSDHQEYIPQAQQNIDPPQRGSIQAHTIWTPMQIQVSESKERPAYLASVHGCNKSIDQRKFRQPKYIMNQGVYKEQRANQLINDYSEVMAEISKPFEVNQGCSPKHQHNSDGFPEQLEDSRNFSIQVNINDDSIPACLERSLQSIKGKTISLQNQQAPHQQFRNIQEAHAVLSENYQNQDILQQPEASNGEFYSQNVKNSHDCSQELLQEPCIELKSENINQQILNQASQEQSGNQGILQVINLQEKATSPMQNEKQPLDEGIQHFNRSDCKILNESSTSKQRTDESKPDDPNRNPISIVSSRQVNPVEQYQDLSNTSRPSSFLTDPHDHSRQQALIHVIDKRIKHLSSKLNPQRPALRQVEQRKEEGPQKKAPIPVVPPCITINIRDNDISLNVYNNSPFGKAILRKQERLPIMREDKSVQNDFIGIEPNETFVEEIQMRELLRRKEEYKLERNSLINASIDLEKEPEIQLIKNIDTSLQTQRIEMREIQIQTIDQPSLQQLNDNAAASTKENAEETYLTICEQADKYLLNNDPDTTTHSTFQELLKPHVSLRLSSEPISTVGDLLFKNGSVLVAIVRLCTRQSKTPFLANYIFEHFKSAYLVEQSRYLFEEEAKKARQQYLNYLDKQYQEAYVRNNAANQSKPEEIVAEGPIKRTSIKPLPESQNISECLAEDRKKKLMLNSNFYSVTEKVTGPQLQKVNQSKRKHLNHNYNSCDPKILEEAIPESNQRSSLSSIELDKKESIKLISEKVFSSQKERQKTNQPGKSIQLDKPSESIQKSRIQSSGKSRVVHNHPPAEEKGQSQTSPHAVEQNTATRFDKLYKKYKQVRESFRASGSIKVEEPSGILKASCSESKEKSGDGDPKKKKNVQFIDEPIESKEHSTDEPGPSKKQRKRRTTKSKGQSSVEQYQEEVVSRYRQSRR